MTTPRMIRNHGIRGDGAVGRPRAHGGRTCDSGETEGYASGGRVKNGSAYSSAHDATPPGPANFRAMSEAREHGGFASGGWIAGAIKHPGAEKRAAAKAGQSTHTYMEEHKGDSGKAGARARLGLRLSAMAKHKG